MEPIFGQISKVGASQSPEIFAEKEIIPALPVGDPAVVDLLHGQKVTDGEAFPSTQNYSCYQLLRQG